MKRRLKIIAEKISSKNGFFSVKQIAKESSISSKDIQIVLDRLFREGLIERFDFVPNPGETSPVDGRPKKRTVYQLANRKKFKERIRPRLKKDTAADCMWKIIRGKESFTIRDLVVLAGAKTENARWFVKLLYREKYITPSKSGGPGVEWSLIRFKDPGPQRPYLGSVRADQRRSIR